MLNASWCEFSDAENQFNLNVELSFTMKIHSCKWYARTYGMLYQWHSWIHGKLIWCKHVNRSYTSTWSWKNVSKFRFLHRNVFDTCLLNNRKYTHTTVAITTKMIKKKIGFEIHLLFINDLLSKQYYSRGGLVTLVIPNFCEVKTSMCGAEWSCLRIENTLHWSKKIYLVSTIWAVTKWKSKGIKWACACSDAVLLVSRTAWCLHLIRGLHFIFLEWNMGFPSTPHEHRYNFTFDKTNQYSTESND